MDNNSYQSSARDDIREKEIYSKEIDLSIDDRNVAYTSLDNMNIDNFI